MAETKDRICGIDRYEHSEQRGELVAPVAYLWKRPGAKPLRQNLTGALKHGDEVTVHEKRLDKGALWCRVSATAVVDGREYPQKGWLNATLLEQAGLQRPGIRTLEGAPA